MSLSIEAQLKSIVKLQDDQAHYVDNLQKSSKKSNEDIMKLQNNLEQLELRISMIEETQTALMLGILDLYSIIQATSVIIDE